jgi:hypothetical protein
LRRIRRTQKRAYPTTHRTEDQQYCPAILFGPAQHDSTAPSEKSREPEPGISMADLEVKCSAGRAGAVKTIGERSALLIQPFDFVVQFLQETVQLT